MNQIQLKNFILFAAIACLITVITTIGIHGLFSYGPLSFEERLLLFKNPIYQLNRWWVIFHCLMVLTAMWGFFLLQFKKSPGFAGLGMMFFAVFSFTEIFRQIAVFFYLNQLRQKYLEATEPGVQEMIVNSMEDFGLIGFSLFGLFILSFALGNLCYGITLINQGKWDSILGWLLLIWGMVTLAIFANEFFNIPVLWDIAEWFSLIFQPLIRLLFGLWLLMNFRQLARAIKGIPENKI